MTHEFDPLFERQLDAYLADEMSRDERAAFEKRIADDPSLRETVDLQRRIDRSLRRTFTPAADAPPLAVAATRRIPRRYVLYAAAVLFVMIGGWLANYLLTPPIDDGPHFRSFVSIYQAEERRGFKPQWICKDDAEFAIAFYHKLQRAMVLKPVPGNVKPLGMSYARVLSENSVFLLVEIDGKRVIVFTDIVEAPVTYLKLEGRDDLHLHHREVDGVHLYELSPFDTPRAMDYLERREMLPEWLEKMKQMETIPPR